MGNKTCNMLLVWLIFIAVVVGACSVVLGWAIVHSEWVVFWLLAAAVVCLAVAVGILTHLIKKAVSTTYEVRDLGAAQNLLDNIRRVNQTPRRK